MRILCQPKRSLPGNRLFFTSLLISSAATIVQSTTRSSKYAFPQTIRGGSTTMSGKNSDPWDSLGGGAVNEKLRQHEIVSSSSSSPLAETVPSSSKYDPSTQRAHLLHALEGMDRYPNYLSRWSLDDVGQLEDALQQQLDRVRQQKLLIQERRRDIEKLVEVVVEQNGGRWKHLLKPPSTWGYVKDHILDPSASKAIFGSQTFARKKSDTPNVQQVISGQVDVELDTAKLQRLMDEEFFDVYSFPLLSTHFCKELREFVTALTEVGKSESFAHLQFGRRAVDFDTVGLGWVNDLLFHLIMRPMTRHLFQSTESLDDLDWRQGYVAGYSASPTDGKPRERLVTHTDDSEVTLNIGLGDGFKGGLVEFRGLRGTDHEGELVGTFQPEEGVALIHAGRHFHDVTQVTSGDRFAFIVWARSWKGVRSQTCPCCWLNRRQDNSCSCGPRWN